MVQILLKKIDEYYQLYVHETESFILEELTSILNYLKDRLNCVLVDDLYLLKDK